MATSGENPMDALDEALKRVIKGDDSGCREFYATLFQTFRDSLIRFLRYRREATPDEAEDSVSNLMLSLFERARAGRIVNAPRSWQAYLRRAVLWQYAADIRKARGSTPRAKDVDLALALHDGIGPDLQAADREEVRRLFERTLPNLTLMEQRVIAMRGQQWTFAEIAEALGTSENSASVLASRARKDLWNTWLKLKAG
jgi:RNA polymerase sigma factor (sigma-70 family)